jgi:hypothetical protein
LRANSEEAIYIFDNFNQIAPEWNFNFSACLQYLAFVPQVSQQIALEFYDSGKMIKQYKIDELVKDMDAVLFTSSGMAFWADDTIFDAATNTLKLTTADGLDYAFDITTGGFNEK